MRSPSQKRPMSFYLLAGFFALFVLFLYGPMSSIFVLSFQGPEGGLTFPMRGVSVHWFDVLFNSQRGDAGAAFRRSAGLGLLVMGITTLLSFAAGLAFRRKFVGSGFIFYLTVISLVMPGLLISLGIGQLFQIVGVGTNWYTSGLGAHLTWTLPFGLLIMFAVFGRFSRSLEEAARDLGASRWKILVHVTTPIIFPGIIAVALFGFTLSYDEIARSVLAIGTKNTLPLEIFNMTQNVTTPDLYAIGTFTTVVSLLVILISLWSIAFIQRNRAGTPGKQ
ncbi:MAG: ABC transporter permease [Gammaproteobacteria bacterium]|nr:ABC transporter permease [Gammaproteobacteria bacterium]